MRNEEEDEKRVSRESALVKDDESVTYVKGEVEIGDDDFRKTLREDVQKVLIRDTSLPAITHQEDLLANEDVEENLSGTGDQFNDRVLAKSNTEEFLLGT